MSGCTKKEIRDIVTQRLGKQSPEWIAATSLVIQERVLSLSEFRSARIVCAYMAMPHEVRTALIFETARELGKRTCIPAYRSDDELYGLSEWTAGEALVPGHHGVLEPAELRWIDIEAVDLMIVPGLAFDMKGGRVGRGKGHYDRILGSAENRSFVAVGLAFGFQVFESVPVEPHDIVLDAVITEKECVLRTHATTPLAM